jgi:hypothetical protein
LSVVVEWLSAGDAWGTEMEKLLALKRDAAAERNPLRRQSEHTIRVKKTQDELDEKEEKVRATRSDQESADGVLFGGVFFLFLGRLRRLLGRAAFARISPLSFRCIAAGCTGSFPRECNLFFVFPTAAG